MAGETFFLTEFTPRFGEGFVAFAGNAPGRIKAIELKGEDFIAQKDAFLCAQEGVDMDIAFTKKLRAGIFGGEGFILERLSGTGTAFIHACGDFIEMELASGEVVKVDTGSVVGFDASVGYDIALAGNVKSMLFGGEGIFLTTLRGPGRVLLQSMTLANLAHLLTSQPLSDHSCLQAQAAAVVPQALPALPSTSALSSEIRAQRLERVALHERGRTHPGALSDAHCSACHSDANFFIIISIYRIITENGVD